MNGLRTEFEFVLPKGYLDNEGSVHREGMMRLATAGDEILPLKDPRVQGNPGYLVVILLSRVVTQLGSLEVINPKVIEGLFAGDLGYLQEFYNRVNGNGMRAIKVVCPQCQHGFEVEPERLGES
jgi:hypothetical protein